LKKIIKKQEMRERVLRNTVTTMGIAELTKVAARTEGEAWQAALSRDSSVPLADRAGVALLARTAYLQKAEPPSFEVNMNRWRVLRPGR
jgi:hypothetical protein